MATRVIKKSFLVVNPPPADMTVPTPPQDFVPTNSRDYAGTKPNKAELASLKDAVTEMTSFADYSGVFGRTAPLQKSVVQTLGAASQWSSLRVTVQALEHYASTHEGLAWVDTRKLIAKLKPAYDLATTNDPTLLSAYPSVARLFDVRSRTARRGAVTREQNRVDKAAKAAAAAVTAAATAPSAAPVAQPPAIASPAPAPAMAVTSATLPTPSRAA